MLEVLGDVGAHSGELLEIGAGTGWQAKALSERGYQVQAIDLASSRYAGERVWPITDYDGQHIPFPDASFDIVYSSEMLEYIVDQDAFQREIARVLKPDGVAVHLLPTTGWRLWTTLSHHPAMLVRATRLASRKLGLGSGSVETLPTNNSPGADQTHGPLGRLRSFLFPRRHGNVGNVFSEMYRFSRLGWGGIFRSTGWRIVERKPVWLFYTGNALLAEKLPLGARRGLSRMLGAAAHIFAVRKS